MLFFSPCHLGSRIILEWYVYTSLLFTVVAPSEEVKLDPDFELPCDMEVAVRDNNQQDSDMKGKQCCAVASCDIDIVQICSLSAQVAKSI